jgi:hypothetical protein
MWKLFAPEIEMKDTDLFGDPLAKHSYYFLAQEVQVTSLAAERRFSEG